MFIFYRAESIGLGVGHHVHPDGTRLGVSGGSAGLALPAGAGAPGVDHVEADFCVQALREAAARWGVPEIVNTD